MSEEEKKTMKKQLEEEQIKLEREFHKTLFGKIIKIVFILTILVMAMGLVSFIVGRILNLDESVFEFGEKCIKYSSISSFICMIVYCIFVPELMGEDKSQKK